MYQNQHLKKCTAALDPPPSQCTVVKMMTLSIILTYHRSAKIFRYIKHELKKCHTRNTVLRYECDMSCYMCNTTNIITECN